MTTEEKARAYDEAIERAKKCLDEKRDTCFVRPNVIFPELAESEDERMVKFIKKQLFDIKKTITENYELDVKLTKAIDWLEKRGKQMSIIDDLEMTLSVSEDAYLRGNIEGLIKEFKQQ